MNQRFLDRLVEQAGTRFSIQAKIAKNKILPHKWSPDIVISRDPGSGGRVIARRLARKLGWQLLDKNILSELANKLHIPEKEFAKIDEHSRNWFADSFNMLFNPNYVSDIRYLKHLKQLLMKNAKDGDVVIVGRGANHVIPADKCLRVRITASFDKRVNNTVKHEKLSREEAYHRVKNVENKRNSFIQQYFGCQPCNPAHFDIVVNTDNLDLKQARDIIIGAYFAKFPAEKKRLQDKL